MVWRAHGEMQVIDPGGDVDGLLQASKVLSDEEDEGVEGTACCLLTELARGEAEDMPGDGDA